MSQNWIHSKAGRQVLGLALSRCPAWLWRAEEPGSAWRNNAARLAGPGAPVGMADHVAPIKGQIRRLLRLGFEGRPSRALVPVTIAGKAGSILCTCTPLRMADGEMAMLCVADRPVPEAAFDDLDWPDPRPDSLLPHLSAYVIADADGRPLFGSRAGLAAFADGEMTGARHREAIAAGELVLIAPADHPPVPTSADDAPSPPEAPGGDGQVEPAPAKDDPPVPPRPATGDEPESIAAAEEVTEGRLTNLLARFESRSTLYGPLGPEDEELPEELASSPEAVAEETETTGEVAAPAVEQPLGPDDRHVDPDDIAALASLDGAETTEPVETAESAMEEETGAGLADTALEHDTATPPEPPAPAPRLWRVTGRGLARADMQSIGESGTSAPLEETAPVTEIETPETAGPADSTRYNFDELARILTDRVGREANADRTAPPHQDAASGVTPASGATAGRRPGGKRVDLTDEHLVLNRLPLGILLFRDQDILFANRAMAELLGCANVAAVRERGLDSIFPRLDESGAAPGPVAVLLDKEGQQVPVNARLQSVTWQGQPALMLSASRDHAPAPAAPEAADAGTARIDVEPAVRAFNARLGELRGEGAIGVDRSGVITDITARGAELFGRPGEDLLGKPLALFIDPREVPAFKTFLEQPARRAETDRPGTILHTVSGLELSLFSQGSAGVVSGYFGLVRTFRAQTRATRPTPPEHADPALLGRLSRGVRRPLNTIIGFAQLIETQAFGELGEPRYVEYARDIHAAGEEITGLVDELDQYTRLQDPRIEMASEPFDLAGLLEECERVVRRQAGRRQVFVRSAISEDLPWIEAERASVRQALLNLLASAIDQTPQGKKVILSAQSEENGSVGVHVRDSSDFTGELAERFAVFREAGTQRDEAMVPLKSSIGLSLTRSLLAVNSFSLSVDPSSGTGTLMTMTIPAERIVARARSAE